MANKYYQKHKERLQKEARERYQKKKKIKGEKRLEKDIKNLLKKKKLYGKKMLEKGNKILLKTKMKKASTLSGTEEKAT